jgi:hypothetical protein
VSDDTGAKKDEILAHITSACHLNGDFDSMMQVQNDPSFAPITRGSLWFVSEKDARAACAKGPAVEAAAREKSKTERAEKREAAMAKGYRIARVSEFAGDWTQAIIETDRDREIKCAALDSDGEYLAVENAYITAPVDDVTFRVQADSVKCWTR